MTTLSILSQRIAADPNKNGSGYVFFEPDEKLCAWLLDQLEPNEVIVDCGAGVGALGAMMPGRVVSLDIMPPLEHNQRSPVLSQDCISWDWKRGNQLPVFIRPCHNGFVHETLVACLEHTHRALYIGLRENLTTDFPDGPWCGEGGDGNYLIHQVEHLDWTGPSGERIYYIYRLGREAVEMGLYSRKPDAPLEESGTGWRRILYEDAGEHPYGPTYSSLDGLTQVRHLIFDVRVFNNRRRSADTYSAWERVMENPRWLRLTSGYVVEKARRELIMKRLEGARRVTIKTKKGRVVVVPVPPLVRWRMALVGYLGTEPRIPADRQDAIWEEVSPQDLKMANDNRAHTDLCYAITVDGEHLSEPSDWNRLEYRDVQQAVQELYSSIKGIRDEDFDINGDIFESPAGFSENPETFPTQAVYLCGNERSVITGIVARPKPGEETPPGHIAVLPNGTVNYDRALDGASAVIIGVGGAVCHVVNVARGEEMVVMRFDRWADLEAGSKIEVDVANRLITLIEAAPYDDDDDDDDDLVDAPVEIDA